MVDLFKSLGALEQGGLVVVTDVVSRSKVAISRKQKTHQNYETWLTPFVAWLEEQAQVRPVVVTSRTISDYLQ